MIKCTWLHALVSWRATVPFCVKPYVSFQDFGSLLYMHTAKKKKIKRKLKKTWKNDEQIMQSNRACRGKQGEKAIFMIA